MNAKDFKAGIIQRIMKALEGDDEPKLKAPYCDGILTDYSMGSIDDGGGYSDPAQSADQRPQFVLDDEAGWVRLPNSYERRR